MKQLPNTPDGTIWAISETHLTQPGIEKMKHELVLHKTGLSLQAGAPVPTRSNTLSAIGGRQRGVAFLSNTPNRTMTATWSPAQWQESRIHSSCFLLANRWVQGGAIYGFSKQPDTHETKQKTESQCQLLVQRIAVHSTGLRFIAGDFNQPEGGIPSMQQLRDLGWINVQQWALEKLNKPILPTCKAATTVDHLYVSPELALYLKNVHVDDTWFADHAILWAEFESLGHPPMLPLWKQPNSIDWKSLNLPDDESTVPDCLSIHSNSMQQLVRCEAGKEEPIDFECRPDNTQKYRSLCKSLEEIADLAHQAVHNKPLMNKQKGRAKVTEVTWVQEYSSPPKVGRHGEVSPEFHGLDGQHAQLLRQTRRLINFVRLAETSDLCSNRSQHRDFLWTSILRAKGFQPDFCSWWKEQKHPYVSAIPWEPPKSQVASHLHTFGVMRKPS